jgi:hypothetical protein
MRVSCVSGPSLGISENRGPKLEGEIGNFLNQL